MVRIRVKTDTRKLRRLRETLIRDLHTGSRGEFGQVVEQWGEHYLADMRQTFKAEGDGAWRQLTPATQAERKRLGFKAARPILRRIGYLFGGLTRNSMGNLFKRVVGGVRVGYGGNFVHPGYIDLTKGGKRTGGGMPLAQIAAIHNRGGPRRTARPILVEPKPATVQKMLRDLRRAFSSFRR